MKLQRPLPRTRIEPIVSMIDVVFFLLVFFMLIGRMDATSPFEVTPPLGRTGTELPGGGVIVAVGEDGQQALNGVSMTQEALVAMLAEMLAADSALPVRVNAHHGASLGSVLPLLGRLEDIGLTDVALVVTPNPP